MHLPLAVLALPHLLAPWGEYSQMHSVGAHDRMYGMGFDGSHSPASWSYSAAAATDAPPPLPLLPAPGISTISLRCLLLGQPSS